jgi:hypothetical protein
MPYGNILPSGLFDPDRIRDGRSLKSLESFSGLQGLGQALKSSLKLGISEDSQELLQREQL